MEEVGTQCESEADRERQVNESLSLLECDEAWARCKGIRQLKLLAKQNDVHVVEALRSHVQKDEGAFVRTAALQALCDVTGVNDETTLALALTALEDEAEAVRACAAKALCEVKDREPVVTPLCTCLMDPGKSVREAAVATLGAIGGKGDTCVIAQILPLLEHLDSDIRASALDALCGVAEPGDDHVIQEALLLFIHPDEQVRHFATQTLQAFAEKGDRRVVNAATAYMKHSDDPVTRQYAILVLGVYAEATDEQATSALLGCLDDSNVRVRLQAACQLVSRGSSWTIYFFVPVGSRTKIVTAIGVLIIAMLVAVLLQTLGIPIPGRDWVMRQVL